MEALCSPRSVEPLESIITCLRALYTLTNSTWTRELLMINKSLGIELCNVLHRLLLTRDSSTAQLLCMNILKQVIKAAQEQLDLAKKNKFEELSTANEEPDITNEILLLGEGGSTGDICPGKSLVFAVLEVCLCLVVRQLPAMSPTPNSMIITSLRLSQNIQESSQLIASSVSSFETLHKLCSPKGAINILPTILYLTTGIIKEMATRNVTDKTIVANNPAVQSALHCLKVLCTDSYCTNEEIGDEWLKLLQSALAKLIDLAKTGSDETKLDEVTMILAIGVFVLNAPSKVVAAPNLQYPCINHFRQCLQSKNSMVSI